MSLKNIFARYMFDATKQTYRRYFTDLVPFKDFCHESFYFQGMFDKPNTAGFLHTSHYLLSVYDSERFQKLVQWPVPCKKTEAKYRNIVKDYLTIISAENPDIGFPVILTSHLIHAGGNKFTIIMWKLSEVVVRKYIARESKILPAGDRQIYSANSSTA